jgi:ubiquinone/menaquinone biosynthesis C-methylase UbiE
MKNQIKHNIKMHNENAKDYDKNHYEIYNSYEQKRIDKTLKKLLGFFKNTKIEVLDFGAGTGNLTLKFLKHDCWVIACDVSSKSLEIIKEKNNSKKLKVVTFNGEKLPFPDNSFDIVAVYSVLHHIPNYLYGIGEMIRVIKPGGLIYIDHEANENKWIDNEKLKEYYSLAKYNKYEEILRLIKTGKFITSKFITSYFKKRFINPRYKSEGDIHVWEDDHIEWNKIKNLIFEGGCEIFHEENYLLYYPKIKLEKYNYFKNKCNDTKLILIKKLK